MYHSRRDEDDAVFSGTVTADAGGFASLSGGFSISKSSDRLKIAAAGVTAFVGAGDTGLQLTEGNLGVVVNTGTKKFAVCWRQRSRCRCLRIFAVWATELCGLINWVRASMRRSRHRPVTWR
jgi:hypothetical protein